PPPPAHGADAPDDLGTLPGSHPAILPAWELRPGEGAPSDEVAAERTRLCAGLRDHADERRIAPPAKTSSQAGGRSSLAIVAPIQALMQPVPAPATLDANALVLTVGQIHPPRKIAEWLAERGFTRPDQVEQPADFALRGGILDIFISAAVDPIRVEFFGDEIESIRQFELSSQRSTRELKSTRIALPPRAADAQADTTSFFNYLSADTLIFLHEPSETQEMGRTLLERLGSPVGMFSVEAVMRKAAERTMISLSRFESAAADAANSFTARTESLPPFEPKAADAVGQLFQIARENPVTVFCDNDGERQRLTE